MLRAIALFPDGRALASRIGPTLFDGNPAARIIAAYLITGTPPAEPGPTLRRDVDALLGRVERCTIPPAHDPEWGLSLIRQLAERQHGPRLADTLRWAAERVDARDLPLAWLRDKVGEAFAIADGDRPLDADAEWVPPPPVPFGEGPPPEAAGRGPLGRLPSPTTSATTAREAAA